MIPFTLFLAAVVALGIPLVVLRSRVVELRDLPLAFGAGLGVLSLLTVLMLLIFRTAPFLGILAVVVPVLLLSLLLVSPARVRVLATPSTESISLLAATGVLFALLFSTAMLFPFTSWDGRFIWGYKALILWNESTVFGESFLDPSRVHFHRDYPLLIPAMEALLYGFSGGLSERWARAAFSTIMLMLCLYLYSSARKELPASAALILVIAFLTTAFRRDFADRDGGTLNSGVADIPLSFIAFLAAHSFWRGALEKDLRDFLLGGFFLGITLHIKAEATVFAFIMVFVLLLNLAVQHGRHVLLSLVVALAVAAPWLILKTQLPNFIDEKFSETLRPSFVPQAIERLPIVTSWFAWEMSRFSRWNIVWAVYVGVLVLGLVRRSWWHLAFWDMLIVGWLAAYVVVYCFSPLHLSYHLQTSVSRLLSHLLPAVVFRIALGLGPEVRAAYGNSASDKAPEAGSMRNSGECA